MFLFKYIISANQQSEIILYNAKVRGALITINQEKKGIP